MKRRKSEHEQAMQCHQEEVEKQKLRRNERRFVQQQRAVNTLGGWDNEQMDEDKGFKN
jgi:hypothetical protein